MKKLILFTILFCSISFGQPLWWDEWGGNLYTSTNAEIYGLNNVPLKHLLGGKYTFSRIGSDLEALFNKIDSLTLAMSSLNIFDDGLTTQILVGGGLNVVPVWGTNLPTAVTIGSAYIYRAGGTDVADGDVADTITITNISQVQDITATATEINYTTDVTSNIQAQIDSKQDTVLGITSAEIAFLDGLTDTVQQQLDLKAPLTAPTFAASITGSYLTASEILGTDASKNIISLAVATYPSLTELTYVKGVTSAIQTQMNLKAPLASPTFTGTIGYTPPTGSGSFIFGWTASGKPYYTILGASGEAIESLDTLGQRGIGTSTPGNLLVLSKSTVPSFDIIETTNSVKLRTGILGTLGYFETVSNHDLTLGTNDIPRMRITNAGKVGIGTTTPDVELSINGAYNYWADTSATANAIKINTNDFSALTTGMQLFIKVLTANTGATTLLIDTLTAKTIKKRNDQDVVTGDIEAGQIIHVIYDGTNFQMLSQLAQ